MEKDEDGICVDPEYVRMLEAEYEKELLHSSEYRRILDYLDSENVSLGGDPDLDMSAKIIGFIDRMKNKDRALMHVLGSAMTSGDVFEDGVGLLWKVIDAESSSTGLDLECHVTLTSVGRSSPTGDDDDGDA